MSLLGDGCAVLAVPLLVLHLTRDPLAAGLAAAPRGVGYLLVGLPAGPIVDRLNPWAVLVVMDVMRAGVFVALAVLAWLGSARLWVILALAFVAGSATVFFDAALTVAVKDLFPRDGLLRANSVLETAAQTSLVLGPALVAAIAATVGIAGALLLNAATFAVSLLSLAAVMRGDDAVRPPRRARRGGIAQGLGGDFMEGLRYLIAFRPLLVLTVIQTMLNLCLAVDTLIVYFARVTLELPLPQVSAVVAGGGVGGIAGAVMAAGLAARIRALPLIASGIAIAAGALLVMGVSTSWWHLLVANSVQVWAVIVVSVVNRSTRQAWVPRDLLGRVTTTGRALFITATPVGAVLAGAVTRAFGDDPRPAFLGAGALMIVIIAAGWLVALRRYDAAPPPQR
ncbi:MFS transporter [Actinomadura sp. HBU206391]|uniref:MFS transporter n=1 Tax=Actinomadura sp. HBU206391 TaxID=2731692 RepID=UPI00164FEF63|nr:MFS transporter [Actinomadura sp. HBU206391]MBC6462201.1 MFS transporter [Actinomadura sp. HBU206391]